MKLRFSIAAQGFKQIITLLTRCLGTETKFHAC